MELRDPASHRRHPVSRLRRRRSGGNALAEWMLVLLPTMALISMFADLSIALFSWSTIQSAVREGARFAITYQTNVVTGQGHDANIKKFVENNSMGLVSATATPNKIFINYYVQNAATGVITPSATNAPGNIVEVSVQGYPLSWLAPISGTLVNPLRAPNPASISVFSSDVMGAYPAGLTAVAR